MKFRNTLILMVVSLLIAIGASSALGKKSDNVTFASLSLDYNFTLLGLTPGNRYETRWYVYSSDDDPSPYIEGYGTFTVPSTGKLVVSLPVDEFEYHKPVVEKVVVCLTAPGSSTPIKDQSGNYVCRTYENENY